MKGGSCIPEDLSRAIVNVWLVSNDDKIDVTRWIDTSHGYIEIPLGAIQPDVRPCPPHPHPIPPMGSDCVPHPSCPPCPPPMGCPFLPANVYSLKAVWYKDRSRCKMAVAEVRNAFAITNYMEEATPFVGDALTVKVKSSAATYGYDGLSAFELACMHGVTTYTSEVEWCRFRGVENILLWLEVNPETHCLEAWWADDGDIKDIYMDKDGNVWVALTDGDACKRHRDGWKDILSYDRRVVVNNNLENEVCPVILEEGSECTVLYENASDTQEFTVSIADEYKTPEGELLTVIVPSAGYAEVSYLMSGGEVFVRGS